MFHVPCWCIKPHIPHNLQARYCTPETRLAWGQGESWPHGPVLLAGDAATAETPVWKPGVWFSDVKIQGDSWMHF